MDVKNAVSRLRVGLSLDSQELADLLDVTPQTVERWRKARTVPQRTTRERIDRLLELERELREVFDSEAAIRSWLNTDNRYLGGIKPIEALRVGRYDRVEAALEALASGVFV